MFSIGAVQYRCLNGCPRNMSVVRTRDVMGFEVDATAARLFVRLPL